MFTSPTASSMDGVFAARRFEAGKRIARFVAPLVRFYSSSPADAESHPNWVGIAPGIWLDPPPSLRKPFLRTDQRVAIQGYSLRAKRHRGGQEITLTTPRPRLIHFGGWIADAARLNVVANCGPSSSRSLTPWTNRLRRRAFYGSGVEDI